MIENEVKLKLTKHKKRQLYGAVCPERSQTQRNYFLQVGKSFIRFREEGGLAYITIKGEDSGEETNRRPEIECEVPMAFFRGFERILGNSSQVKYYKKGRAKNPSHNRHGMCIVYFDSFFGEDYLELEGSKRGISEFIKRYQLEALPREKRSYLEMLNERERK